jgi:prolyl oligopeptidase
MSLTGFERNGYEELIHGVPVHDPYRWLEDRSSPKTERWIQEQQRRCESYFAECKDFPAIRERVCDYLDIDVIDQPARVRGLYFYRRRKRGQEQAGIYARDTLTEQERLLVDPSQFGPFASVRIHRISNDGSLLAYELKRGGGDCKAIHFLDVERGLVFPDHIQTGYARGLSFSADDSGFYYCHELIEATGDHEIRLHRFAGTPEDQVCFRADRTPGSRLVLVGDNIHLGAIHTREVEGNGVVSLWIARRTSPDIWWCVFSNRSRPYSPILRQGRIFVLDYQRSHNCRLVELDFSGAEIRTVIPERTARISQLVSVGDKIFLNYLDRMMPVIECWTLTGKKHGCIDVPLDGTVQLVPAEADYTESIFYLYESLSRPAAIFEFDLLSERAQICHRVDVARALPCFSREETYLAKDGTVIPITLASSRPKESEQQRPLIMTSYGGFGVSVTPQFSVLVAIMMELGVTFALPHIRGGGEFGTEWHDAARQRNRQTAFDDFIAAAEWLCSKRITTPQQLAIFGGSNSGLLVGAAMTQRPDLFRAVLCISPLLDMVRYELFDQAGRWAREYGTVIDPDDFAALNAYSPYHHVAEGINYPSVLFVSGDKDDRCNPAHVRKMAARLQEDNVQTSAVIVDYSEERGHSPVLPLSVRIDSLARRIAFLCRELKLTGMGGSREAASD